MLRVSFSSTSSALQNPKELSFFFPWFVYQMKLKYFWFLSARQTKKGLVTLVKKCYCFLIKALNVLICRQNAKVSYNFVVVIWWRIIFYILRDHLDIFRSYILADVARLLAHDEFLSCTDDEGYISKHGRPIEAV